MESEGRRNSLVLSGVISISALLKPAAIKFEITASPDGLLFTDRSLRLTKSKYAWLARAVPPGNSVGSGAGSDEASGAGDAEDVEVGSGIGVVSSRSGAHAATTAQIATIMAIADHVRALPIAKPPSAVTGFTGRVDLANRPQSSLFGPQPSRCDAGEVLEGRRDIQRFGGIGLRRDRFLRFIRGAAGIVTLDPLGTDGSDVGGGPPAQVVTESIRIEVDVDSAPLAASPLADSQLARDEHSVPLAHGFDNIRGELAIGRDAVPVGAGIDPTVRLAVEFAQVGGEPEARDGEPVGGGEVAGRRRDEAGNGQVVSHESECGARRGNWSRLSSFPGTSIPDSNGGGEVVGFHHEL